MENALFSKAIHLRSSLGARSFPVDRLADENLIKFTKAKLAPFGYSYSIVSVEL